MALTPKDHEAIAATVTAAVREVHVCLLSDDERQFIKEFNENMRTVKKSALSSAPVLIFFGFVVLILVAANMGFLGGK